MPEVKSVPITMRASRCATLMAMFAIVAGCHDRIAGPVAPIDRAASLTAVSVVDQTAMVGATVPSSPTVVVRDAAGNPVAGVLVVFDGAVTRTVYTASDGTAALNWMLPFTPGSYSILVHAGKLTPIQFNISAVAGPPARIVAQTPVDVAVPPGVSVAQPPTVVVTDYVNNPLAGVAVVFETGGPPGSAVEHTSVVTNQLGIASPGAWTLGTAFGVYTLTASVDGVPNAATMKVRVYEPFVVSTIAAGANATCANALSGATYCWGDNFAFPTKIQGDAQFVSLSVGTGFACGLTAAGAAHCWGRDVAGVDPTQSSAILGVPHRIGGDAVFRLISAGETLACGLNMDGRALCWGENAYGQLGNATTVGSALPVPVAGEHSFVALTTGIWHACGVTASGETYCWGRNDARQLGDFSSDTCDVAVDDYYYGKVLVHAPCSKVPQRVSVVPLLTSVSAHDGTCGLSGDGQAFCWGLSHGVDLVSSTVRFANIAATQQIVIQPPPAATMVSSPMCGTTLSGAISCGGASGRLIEVSSHLALSMIVAGNGHQCGVQSGTGVAYCWGSNSFAQLGNGTRVTTNAPMPVPTP